MSSPSRLLDQLERRSRDYWHQIRAGHKNPRLAAELFDLVDEIREKTPGRFAPVVERLLRETEMVVRIANTGRRQEIETARLQQIDTIAATRDILKLEAA